MRKNDESKGKVYVFTGDGKGKTSAAIGVAMRAVGTGLRVAWIGWYKQATWKMGELALPKLVGEDRFQMYLMGKGFHISSPETVVRSQGKTVKKAAVGKRGVVVDLASEEEHKAAAQAALEKAKEILELNSKLETRNSKQSQEILRFSGGTNSSRNTPSIRNTAADSRLIQSVSEPVATEGKQDDKSDLTSLSDSSNQKSVDVLVLDEANNAVDDNLIELAELIELISNRGETHIVVTGRKAHPKLIEVADLVTEMKKVKHPFDKGELAIKGLDY
jgi:ATP:corrinoid adenosyltransferase